MDFGDRKYFLIVQRWIVQLIGFWPGSDDIRIWQVALAFLSPLESFFVVAFQLAYFFTSNSSFLEYLRMFSQIVVQVMNAFKILFIALRRKELKTILDFLKKGFECKLTIQFIA